MTAAVVQGPRPSRGNRVEFLIDNEAAWGRLAEDIASARTSLRCMLFMLDLPHVRLGFAEDPAGRPGAPGSVRMEEALLAAARRGVEVDVLLNDVRPGWSPANTSRAVERYFARHDGTGRIRLRRFTTPQAAPIHAKLFIIDDALAYSIGSIFAQEYFDGPAHAVDDPRRGHLRWRSSVLAPNHDVSARVTGPATADLDAVFRLHWDHCGPDDRTERKPDDRTGTIPVQVTRTLHGGRFAALPQGETGVHESYRTALAEAEEFVYLENQYLTSTAIVDELVAALRRSRDLQVIALLNSRPDIPGYPRWQAEALERLWTGVRRAGAANRVGVYTAWSHEGRSIIRTHIHSKVAIVDDRWLTVGSANLDGLSTLASDHRRRASLPVRWLGRVSGVFGPEAPELVRATEVNLSIADFDGGDGAAVRHLASGLRRRLWAEHLGLDDAELVRPEGGWAALWRERAELKLRGLREAPGEPVASRILPFPHEGTRVPLGLERPEAYLRALGLGTEGLDVRRRLRSFRFDTGAWKP
ncbi:phospholipase D-like domain-containing protein [Glycomyces luteolus]|uniref:Phospholipase D-like domain-containing protein n=1 Tax=Glycomyces luteolus TaxID=2670330 RepID=A0A9X3SRG7_9ACTN|nr:phospholipase D-like domain-containing protein [Glycomyces luteolus]MDA1359924.1 phospholipase D-like domain-containing protein [Glycomyces luteolus]